MLCNQKEGINLRKKRSGPERSTDQMEKTRGDHSQATINTKKNANENAHLTKTKSQNVQKLKRTTV